MMGEQLLNQISAAAVNHCGIRPSDEDAILKSLGALRDQIAALEKERDDAKAALRGMCAALSNWHGYAATDLVAERIEARYGNAIANRYLEAVAALEGKAGAL